MQIYVGMQGKTQCIAFAGSSIRQISSAAGGSTNAASSSCVSTTHPAGKLTADSTSQLSSSVQMTLLFRKLSSQNALPALLLPHKSQQLGVKHRQN